MNFPFPPLKLPNKGREEYFKIILFIHFHFFPFPLLKQGLKLSSWQHKKQLGKEIIISCKIHMVEEETLEGGPKGREREELGEEE